MSNLIIYYSRRGENYCSGSIRDLKRGNTEIAAQFIRDAVGGDLCEVQTVREYSKDYYKCIEEAKEELNSKARPALKSLPDISSYTNIFIGYPNWWGTMPMAMFTLLESLNWSGKTIIPFCTNEGSGMGSSERDIASICKGAKLVRGLSVHGTEVSSLGRQIALWAKKCI